MNSAGRVDRKGRTGKIQTLSKEPNAVEAFTVGTRSSTDGRGANQMSFHNGDVIQRANAGANDQGLKASRDEGAMKCAAVFGKTVQSLLEVATQ